MRFKRIRVSISSLLCFVSQASGLSSGRPEDRTQRRLGYQPNMGNQPSTTVLIESGTSESNRPFFWKRGSWSQTRRAPNCTSARCCLVHSVRTVGFEPGHRSAMTGRIGPPVPRTGAITRLRYVLMSAARMGVEPISPPTNLPVGARRAVSCADRRTGRVVLLCARTFHAVDWEALESSSPALQAGARPSQLPVRIRCWMNPRKKPDVAVTPGFA